MTEDTKVIHQKNKDIQKFIGWTIEKIDSEETDEDFIDYWYVRRDEEGQKQTFSGEEMERVNPNSAISFNRDWYWLMQAVEYVESLGYKVKMCRRRCQICKDEKEEVFFIDIKTDSKKMSVFEAIHQFVLTKES